MYNTRRTVGKRTENIPAKTKAAGFKLAPEYYREFEKRAEQSGVRVSTWMRSILLQAVGQKPHKGYLRIREPDRTSD